MPRRRAVKPVARLGCEDEITPWQGGKGLQMQYSSLMVKLLSSIDEVKQYMKLIKSRHAQLEENLSEAQEFKKDSESDDDDDDPLDGAVH